MKQAMSIRFTFIALALLAGAGSARGQGAQFMPGGAVVVRPSLAYVAANLDSLSIQYRQFAATAAGPFATLADRQAYARFVRSAIVPQLKVDIAGLYVTFDSLGGGAFAVPAALFDLETIDLISKDVERSAGSDTRELFNARAYALNAVLQGYFAKTQLLVLPMVADRLTKAALISAAPHLIETITP